MAARDWIGRQIYRGMVEGGWIDRWVCRWVIVDERVDERWVD